MREAIGKDEKERNKSLGFLEERGDRKHQELIWTEKFNQQEVLNLAIAPFLLLIPKESTLPIAQSPQNLLSFIPRHKKSVPSWC